MKTEQIGCGYCKKENNCEMRDPKINKAKQGCKEWEHWQSSKEKNICTNTGKNCLHKCRGLCRERC